MNKQVFSKIDSKPATSMDCKEKGILTSPNPSKGGEEDLSSPNTKDKEQVIIKNKMEGIAQEITENDNSRPGYITADLDNYKYLKDIRAVLKENYTEAEKIMWEFLRNKKTGHKIRRQHVIDNFITDFVCLSKKVVIEIDGKIHLSQKEQDELRTYTLNEKGYKVIRYKNEEVIANPQLVANQIKKILDERQSPI